MAECKSCGGFVTDDYARVFGDNENTVTDCRNCPTVRTTTTEASSDDGRQVLLRDVRESTDRDQSAETGSAVTALDGDSGDGASATGESTPEESTSTGDDDSSGGRIQSGLSAVVSALRS